VLAAFLDESRRFEPTASGRGLVAGWCRADAKGIWTLDFQEVAVTPGRLQALPYTYPVPASFTGKIRLERVDQGGKHLASVVWSAPPGELEVSEDFDGDGVPELLVQESGASTKTLWTVRGGAVIRYPGTERFSILRVEDSDKDGRLDLVYSDPFNGPWEEFNAPPEFLAHGLPGGGFSIDDAVALEQAQNLCDGMPAKLTSGILYPQSLYIVLCARLHGVPEKALVPQINALCRGKFGCQERAAHFAWARAEPFFHLPPADGRSP
jgi:hypothetical protein